MFESLTPTAMVLAASTVFAMAWGYRSYIREMLWGGIEENAATWLMFSYGTALLTLLEWDRGAHPLILALPITCSIGSLVVAWMCYKRGLMSWARIDWWDRSCILIDILLTIGYASAWGLLAYGTLTPKQKEDADLAFLLLSNASTFVAFIPLIRGAIRERTEEWKPWGIWTVSYTFLLVLTYEQHGWNTTHWELQLYPASCILLHMLVMWIAQPYRVKLGRLALQNKVRFWIEFLRLPKRVPVRTRFRVNPSP